MQQLKSQHALDLKDLKSQISYLEQENKEKLEELKKQYQAKYYGQFLHFQDEIKNSNQVSQNQRSSKSNRQL